MNENEKRVDTQIPAGVYVWASTEAAKLGVSRRKFFSMCIKYVKRVMSKHPDRRDEIIAEL